MKNALYVLVAGAFAVASCSTGRGILPGANDAAEYKMLELDVMTVPFTVEDAEREIKAVVDDKNLTIWRTKWALGGEFKNISDFFPKSEKDTSTGTIMWFTLDSANISLTNDRDLVLGCERWDRRDRRKRPRASTIIAPDAIFTFAGNRTDFSLEKHEMLSSRSVDRSMRNKEARRRMKVYNKKVRKRLHVERKIDYNRDCGAFFQNNPERGETVGLLTRFVNQQDAVGMRYYFALDSAEKINKIRIILIATDKNGSNLLRPGKEGSTAPLILQKSIPPHKR